jgi:cytochrome c5
MAGLKSPDIIRDPAGLGGSEPEAEPAGGPQLGPPPGPLTVESAVKGIRAMPAKGGNPDLENVEVERAVVYMAGKAGANWKEPPVKVAAKSPERTGQQVVDAVCGKCHLTGANGAPRIGDRDQWRERVKAGYKLVLDSALRGHAGMPARGGMAELSDAEIGRAVEYMMNMGAGKIAIPAQAAAPAPVGAAGPGAATPLSAGAPAAAGKPDGKKIYDTTCTVCHGAGVAGAPKFGDKAAWAPRIKTGMDAIYKIALGGKGAMPPKGGNTALSDADVKAAVDYMVAAAK